MTLKLLMVSVFRRRILQRIFLRVPRLPALPPKFASRTRFQIFFGFRLNKSQVVIDRIKNESAYEQLYDRPWERHIRLIRLLPSKEIDSKNTENMPTWPGLVVQVVPPSAAIIAACMFLFY